MPNFDRRIVRLEKRTHKGVRVVGVRDEICDEPNPLVKVTRWEGAKPYQEEMTEEEFKRLYPDGVLLIICWEKEEIDNPAQG